MKKSIKQQVSSNLTAEPSLADGPSSTEERFLECQYTKLVRWTYFGWWTSRVQRRDSLNASHKTWQTNLLWPIDPPYRGEMPWMSVKKLGRWTYFGKWTPRSRADLADKPSSADGPPNTRADLAGRPTLINEPPSARAEMIWIPLHKTWQMILLWLMDWLLVVQNGNFTLLLTSSDQKWHIHIATNI